MPRPMSGPHGIDRANPNTTNLGKLSYPLNTVYYSTITGKAYLDYAPGRLEIVTNLTVDDINGTRFFKNPDRRHGWAVNLAQKGVVSAVGGDYSND